MKLFRAFDASMPPPVAPAGCQAVVGYIGGRTPHVWTLEEWRRFAHLRQAPAWTADFGGSAVREGAAAVAAARKLGWADHALERRVIWLDAETTVNLPFMQDAAAEVHQGGYLPGIYGSASTAVDYAVLGWPLWIAQWNSVPTVPPLPDVDGHQYAANLEFAGTTIDLSVFDSTMWRHFGDRARHS